MSKNSSYSRSLAMERGVVYVVCIVLCVALIATSLLYLFL